ncbi:kinase-like domain-containing protein [Tanacetum coccineum]
MNSLQAKNFLCFSPISFLFYGLAIICLTSTNVSASYDGNETDYLALLSFKSKITHDPYKVLTSWNHSFDFCDWSGISCGKRHKRVTALQLNSQGLEGSLSASNVNRAPLPESHQQLSMLARLYLYSNKLEGHIPSSLGMCKELNGLSGSIPSEIKDLKMLSYLDLSYNNLSGTITSSLDKWNSLEFLNLSFNDFEGKVPVTGVFANASAFSVLGNNRLCGGSVTLELPKCKEKGKNLIGEGGFSSVYKGILNCDDDDDRFVAVKVLHLQNQGAHKSFLAECEVWRNIPHRNLLKIITSCSSVVIFQGQDDFKALVYEFMPNGSVHDWLHSSENTSKLNLIQRINILRDVATALDYIHNRMQTLITT